MAQPPLLLKAVRKSAYVPEYWHPLLIQAADEGGQERLRAALEARAVLRPGGLFVVHRKGEHEHPPYAFPAAWLAAGRGEQEPPPPSPPQRQQQQGREGADMEEEGEEEEGRRRGTSPSSPRTACCPTPPTAGTTRLWRASWRLGSRQREPGRCAPLPGAAAGRCRGGSGEMG